MMAIIWPLQLTMISTLKSTVTLPDPSAKHFPERGVESSKKLWSLSKTDVLINEAADPS